MNVTYAIPEGHPSTRATLRGMRTALFTQNIRGPHRIALTPAQWRELEHDLLQADYYWIPPWRGGFRVEDFEVTRLVPVTPVRSASPRPRAPSLFTIYDELAQEAWAAPFERLARSERGDFYAFARQMVADPPSPVQTSHSHWSDR